MAFVNSMSFRMYEMSQGALKLMKQDLVIPSLCLVRAAWENMAVTYELANLIKNSCDNNDVSLDIDDILMRIHFANRYERDNRYVGESHYEAFKDYKAKNILTSIKKVEKAFPQTKDFYNNISEFVHPNGDGVGASYSKLEEETDITIFGPQIDRRSQLFPAFVTTLSCSISLYLQFIDSIKDNLADFTRLCEDYLDRKNEDLK